MRTNVAPTTNLRFINTFSSSLEYLPLERTFVHVELDCPELTGRS
jgi:hypothetical protein